MKPQNFYKILLFTFLFFGFITANSITEIAVIGEICNNGIDDDNDGLIDLNDPDCDCEIVEHGKELVYPRSVTLMQ
jgi:hypothetical protein